MADNRFQTCDGFNSGNFKEAVCIDTSRIYDSCSDKDCLEDLRVYFTECNQRIVDQAVSVRSRRADVITVYIDIEPVPFNKGFYSVDMTFFFDVVVDVYASPAAHPCTIDGLAVFNKKVILYGSEGAVKVFASDYRFDDSDDQYRMTGNLPKAVCQAGAHKWEMERSVLGRPAPARRKRAGTYGIPALFYVQTQPAPQLCIQTAPSAEDGLPAPYRSKPGIGKRAASTSGFVCVRRFYSFCFVCLLMASKLSLLMTCSMRQASCTAVSGSTPRVISQSDKRVWRSYIFSAICRPVSSRIKNPSGSTSMYPFSRRFFIATLTLGLENPSSLATSMERTAPLRFCSINIVSR